MNLNIKTKKILDLLEKEDPGAGTKIALRFKNPLQLLIATILSAQCTDERVNKVTPALFKKYKTAVNYAASRPAELEELIKSINFFRNKAKSIRACAEMLVEDFNGKVPRSIEECVKLPGVGRKTASVVLASGYGIPAIAVDTHVKRVSGRLGLTNNTDPNKIEEDLKEIIPEARLIKATSLLILHGRRVCKARKPLCGECVVRTLCNYFKETVR